MEGMAQFANCSDLTVLLNRMHTDLEVYCEAVAELSHIGGARTLNVAYERSERARIAFEAARDRLNAHIAQHGCVALKSGLMASFAGEKEDS
jgi:hypothetical protein